MKPRANSVRVKKAIMLYKKLSLAESHLILLQKELDEAVRFLSLEETNEYVRQTSA